MSAAPDEGGPIRVGVAVPEGTREAGHAMRARLDVFCEALATAVGVRVIVYGLAHYKDLLGAMHEGGIDVAWLPPVVALHAAARGRTIPIAIPVRHGSATFSSALFTRPGAHLKRPADLVAVRAAWVDRQSAAGYLVIRAALRAQGVDLDRAFSAEVYLGSHEAVVQAVLSGAADVGATFVHLDQARHVVVHAGWGAATPQVIAYGGPIPSDVIAASIRTSVPIIRKVQRALCEVGPFGAVSEREPRSSRNAPRALAVAAEKLFGAEGFVAPTAEHLEPLSRLLEHMDERPGASMFPPPLA
jgi:phosphonate transport system substrate-binding protein